MDLETVIQGEISRKKKNKYHVLTNTMYVESRKMVQTNLFAEPNRVIETKYMDTKEVKDVG